MVSLGNIGSHEPALAGVSVRAPYSYIAIVASNALVIHVAAILTISSTSTNAYPAAAISDAMANDNITEYCEEVSMT